MGIMHLVTILMPSLMIQVSGPILTGMVMVTTRTEPMQTLSLTILMSGLTAMVTVLETTVTCCRMMRASGLTAMVMGMETIRAARTATRSLLTQISGQILMGMVMVTTQT